VRVLEESDGFVCSSGNQDDGNDGHGPRSEGMDRRTRDEPSAAMVTLVGLRGGRARHGVDRTDLYHRVLSYSGPLRIWMQVGDRDLYNPNVMRDGMHDWVEANERMASALAANAYPYQFMFVRNAGHCDRAVKAQTLPTALECVWAR
jgi:hypothetical protein